MIERHTKYKAKSQIGTAPSGVPMWTKRIVKQNARHFGDKWYLDTQTQQRRKSSRKHGKKDHTLSHRDSFKNSRYAEKPGYSFAHKGFTLELI